MHLKTKVMGELDPETLKSTGNLATAHAAANDYKSAAEIYGEVLSKQEACLDLGWQHPSTLITASNLVAALIATGDFPSALTLSKKVFDTDVEVLGRHHVQTLLAATNHGIALVKTHAYADAVDALRFSAGGLDAKFGANHPHTLVAFETLANVTKLLATEQPQPQPQHQHEGSFDELGQQDLDQRCGAADCDCDCGWDDEYDVDADGDEGRQGGAAMVFDAYVYGTLN